MFKSLGLKIAGFMTLVAGFFAIKSKFQEHKIENLEEENYGLTELDTIQAAVKKAEIKAEAKEDAEIKDFDDSDWRNNV